MICSLKLDVWSQANVARMNRSLQIDSFRVAGNRVRVYCGRKRGLLRAHCVQRL